MFGSHLLGRAPNARLHTAMLRKKPTRLETAQVDIDELDQYLSERREKEAASARGQKSEANTSQPIVEKDDWQRSTAHKSISERIGIDQ